MSRNKITQSIKRFFLSIKVILLKLKKEKVHSALYYNKIIFQMCKLFYRNEIFFNRRKKPEVMSGRFWTDDLKPTTN